jgi:hypothetical protein
MLTILNITNALPNALQQMLCMNTTLLETVALPDPTRQNLCRVWHSAKPLPSVALGKGPLVNFSMVKALWALGKDGTRQRKVGRDGASLLTIHLSTAGPVGTRQKK